MTLHVHRAAGSEALAGGLADLLADRSAAPDPFAWETVVVPARGVERWLTQRLAHRLGVAPGSADGVCAGVRFLRPSSLVGLLTGTERDDPWRPDRLVWRVLEVLDASLGEPWCAVVSRHLGHGYDGVEAELRRSRRYAVARRLAQLFDSYAGERPGLLAAWAAGQDTDGAGGTLPADLTWQAELWRRVLARVPLPSPDQRHAATLAGLRDGSLALPAEVTARISLFGHTRLNRAEIELLVALAEQRDVHLWLPEPSADLTDRLRAGLGEHPASVVPRSGDDTGALVRHPLLAALGRDTRELERSLVGLDAIAHRHPEPATAPQTLLGWLQSDLRADRLLDPALRGQRVHQPADRSVQVHAAHGPARQVEVLREALVGLLADDESLQPRDIVVMCPDVEAYAPLIQAAFGLGAGEGQPAVGSHPAHRLRVRLADRGLGETNPLLGVARQLIALASGRAKASELLDLVATAPVRRRFGFSDNDLEQISGWVRHAEIRWGIDHDQRARFGIGFVEQNTWRRGLDRLLLGVTMAEYADRAVGDTLPLDGVPSGEIDLAGRLAELVERIETATAAMRSAGPAVSWMAALRDGVCALTSVPLREAWMQTQFERELAAIADAGSGADEVLVSLPDVRTLLDQRLAARPTRSNFRTGNLTVCTMTPMRSVPHRVVCLLGLDDGVFPRGADLDGDDLLARGPLTGERDRRSEDRQLLLDAVLAAGETLVITYTGASEHTGQPRPPAVPVGELLDALDQTAAAPVRDRVLAVHPLQPFGERNFVSGELGPGPFSFDPTSLAGARARRHRAPVPALVGGELPVGAEVDLDVVDLDQLRAFWRNPAREFLRGHDVAVRFAEDEFGDAIPIDLNGLERWAIGDRLLAAQSGGADPEQVRRAESLRGALPPGALGATLLDDIGRTASVLGEKAAKDRVGPAAEIDVALDLPGAGLTGSVAGFHSGPDGARVVAMTYSSIRAGIVAGTWVDVLAAAAQTGREVTGVIHGRYGRGTRRAVLGPVDPELARTQLDLLIGARVEGLRRPLPVPVGTGFAWARSEPGRQRWRAKDAWEGEQDSPIPGEREDPAYALLFGQASGIQVLLDAGLAHWADRLWGALVPLTRQVP